jgi:hypothetical protein
MLPGTFTYETVCPYCGVTHDGMTALVKAEHRPSEGAANICARCGEISIFNEDGSLRRATATEQAEVAAQLLRMMTPKVV